MFQYPEAIPDSFQDLHTPTSALKASALSLLDKCSALILQSVPLNDSLASGSLGTVLYHYEAYRVFGRNVDADRSGQLLESIIKKLNAYKPDLFNASYARGISGLGYLLQHFSSQRFTALSMETEFSEIDHYLFLQADIQIKQHKNDWLHGAFGIIFYFLSREQTPVIQEYLEILLSEILKKDHDSKAGILTRNFLTHSDPARVNLGLSHGQVGFLLILMQAFRSGFKTVEISEHISNAISAILEFKRNPMGDKLSFFPFEVLLHEQEHAYNNRLAWCYGDLNLAILLYEAYTIFKNDKYKNFADRIGFFSVKRISPDATLCADSHFCHGSSGLAQTYKRLHVLRSLPDYEKAYLHWIGQTIHLLQKDLEKGLYRNRETAFLEGLLGPVMVLLSFVSEEDLDWPRYWLL